MSSTPAAPGEQEALRIPVIEERLAVGTRVVDTGRGVRIHKTVGEQAVAVDEGLLRDELHVEHVPVGRVVGAGEAPATRYEGDTLVVPVLEEVLVLERKVRIKEELHITRVRHEERHAETVSLKAERVEVERFDEALRAWSLRSLPKEEEMHHTLVAVFDNRTDAQSAYDKLLSSGFGRDSVRLSGTDTAADGTNKSGGIGSSLKRYLQDLFGDEHKHHAGRYEQALERGQHVVTLGADSLPEVERAADIVEAFHPIDIDEHVEGVGADAGLLAGGAARQGATPGGTLSAQSAQPGQSSQSSQSGQSAKASQSAKTAWQAQSASGERQGGPGAASLQRDTGASATIPVVEEELRVGKREVQRGGVRIFSRIVETPVHETIGLREEHVDVQRRKVDQPVAPGDPNAFKEQTIEMRESIEEPMIEKAARITEEVSIGKHVSERQQQIDETLRHTELDIEQLGAGANLRADEQGYREHFDLNYGTSGGAYDDYAPAYAYGSQVARTERYAGRGWDEIEPELRSDWEARDATDSTWEKTKAAVRHGWERVTGGGGRNGGKPG